MDSVQLVERVGILGISGQGPIELGNGVVRRPSDTGAMAL